MKGFGGEVKSTKPHFGAYDCDYCKAKPGEPCRKRRGAKRNGWGEEIKGPITDYHENRIWKAIEDGWKYEGWQTEKGMEYPS